MPVVALLLGVGLLGETLTIGAIAGLILIALGAWLATGRHRQARTSTEDSNTTAMPACTTAPPPAGPPVPPSTAHSSRYQTARNKADTAEDGRRLPVLFPGQYGALAGRAPAERELTEETRGTSAFTWSSAPAEPGIRYRVATMGTLPCCSRPWQ
jgi:hypothetical protein